MADNRFRPSGPWGIPDEFVQGEADADEGRSGFIEDPYPPAHDVAGSGLAGPHWAPERPGPGWGESPDPSMDVSPGLGRYADDDLPPALQGTGIVLERADRGDSPSRHRFEAAHKRWQSAQPVTIIHDGRCCPEE